MRPMMLAMPGSEGFAAELFGPLGCDRGSVNIHHFPDGETLVQIDNEVRGRDLVLVAQLDRPDDKFLALYFTASTARELGARRIGLVVPYLPYMRQDARFHPGEGVTSVHFARLLSQCCDWLVTVDPHLHRHHDLATLYAAPATVVHAAPAISRWISENVERPLLVGPDGESDQWVAEVAGAVACPYTVLDKQRHGDRDVEVALRMPSAVEDWKNRTPVLVDDIVSTAHTMIVAAALVRESGMPAPVCVAVHALFCGKAAEELRAAGVARICSCNTVVHDSNAISVSLLLVSAIEDFLHGGSGTGRRATAGGD